MATPFLEAIQGQQRLNLAEEAQKFYEQQITKQQADELKQASIIGPGIQQWIQQNQVPPPPPPVQSPPPGQSSQPMTQPPPMGALGGMSQMPQQGALPPPPAPPLLMRPPSGGNPALGVSGNFQNARPQDVQGVIGDLQKQGFQQSPMGMIRQAAQGAPGGEAVAAGIPPPPDKSPTETMMERVPPNKLPPPAYIYEQAIKKGADPGLAYQSAERYYNLYAQQQKDQLEELRIRHQVDVEKRQYELLRLRELREARLEDKGSGAKPEARTALQKDAGRLQELEDQGKTNTAEYRALKHKLEGSGTSGGDLKPSPGYRWTGPDKTQQEPIPGGPADPKTITEKTGARQSQGQAARLGLVKAGIHNSLNRLAEIEKKYPDLNTSAFFGTHGDNPITRGVYGVGKGAMSSEQKQADAAWSSFIDEAIPVFTGGLRGSDAFRRFLIEQAPGPGDDKKSREEKIRLIRANIEGTSRTFFNRFASNPSMWAEGTKPEDIEAVKQQMQGESSGGEWKVEKVK